MKITGFGEILWDDFPDGKRLGGAPLNLLVGLQSLGADTAIVSRIGNDADGREILRQVGLRKVASHLIQTDMSQATGLVKVMLADDGNASYDIVFPCAWDFIRAEDEAVRRVAESDAFVFGSLAGRHDVSRRALDCLLEHARFKIFDVNLRHPHYDYDRILALLKQCDLVKLNDAELYELAAIYGSPYHSLQQNAAYLADYAGCSRICATMAEHGAMYYDNGRFHFHCGYRVRVADTVGAGDSFLAGFTYKLLNRSSPAEILDFACALGALTASRPGANPAISLQEIEEFMNPA
ncbi:MAG: carbohydrate kinase [Neisseria sp.]|nr:carbohydrate kinase [Neisseria sp.]